MMTNKEKLAAVVGGRWVGSSKCQLFDNLRNLIFWRDDSTEEVKMSSYVFGSQCDTRESECGEFDAFEVACGKALEALMSGAVTAPPNWPGLDALGASCGPVDVSEVIADVASQCEGWHRDATSPHEAVGFVRWLGRRSAGLAKAEERAPRLRVMIDGEWATLDRPVTLGYARGWLEGRRSAGLGDESEIVKE